MKNLIYKINDKVTMKEIKSFFNKMDKKTRKELYFSVRNPYKEINAIKNSDIITARIKKVCLFCNQKAYKIGEIRDCSKCNNKGEIIELIGIARIVSDKNYYFYATDFMVIPEMRKQRIATEMMKRVIKYCKKKGFIKIFLVPAKGLEKFYGKFGFKVSEYPQMVILQKGIHNG